MIINMMFSIEYLLLIYCCCNLISLTNCDVNLNVVVQTQIQNDKYNYGDDDEAKVSTNEYSNFIDNFPEHPLQLIRPDKTHKNLVIVEENMKFLHGITEPVSIISVVGKFHSGKSFLMNQIMAKSNGFGIGSKVTPETMGIWIWGKPIKLKNDANREWTLLLDTEGFAATNISETYDSKIFSVSTLLSSLLLYNSVKIIDQSDIDYLELLSRQTQLFALKATMTPGSNSSSYINADSQILHFPSLIWVVKDFVQEKYGDSCKEWLLELLQTHTRETETHKISLKEVFPSVDCHTMFIPCANKSILANLSLANESDLLDEYKADRESLIDKIHETVRTKYRNGKPLIGSEFAALFRMLVNAANSGTLTEIPNRWDSFLDKLKQSSIDECLRFYMSIMNTFLEDEHNNEAISNKQLQERYEMAREKAFTLLNHLLQGLEEHLITSQQLLNDKIIKSYALIQIWNQQRIQAKVTKIRHSLEQKISTEIVFMKFPVSSKQIDQQSEYLKQNYTEKFIEELNDLVDLDEINDDLKIINSRIDLLINDVHLENEKHLNLYFDKEIDLVIEETDRQMGAIVHVPPMQYAQFENHISETSKQALKTLTNKLEIYVEEQPIYKQKLIKYNMLIDELIANHRKMQDKAVKDFLTNEINDCLQFFEERLNKERSHFPIEMDEFTQIINKEMEHLKTNCLHPLEIYSTYECFVQQKQFTDKKLDEIIKNKENENLKAFLVEVETPLQAAKQTILISSHLYNNFYDFKKFIKDVCMIQLNQGKAKNWSNTLKTKVINIFVKSNQDLLNELESKRGFWSSIVSFFKWLYDLIFFWRD